MPKSYPAQRHASSQALGTGVRDLDTILDRIPNRQIRNLPFDLKDPRFLGLGPKLLDVPSYIRCAKVPRRLDRADGPLEVAVFDVDKTIVNGSLATYFRYYLKFGGIVGPSPQRNGDFLGNLIASHQSFAGLREEDMLALTRDFVRRFVCHPELQRVHPVLDPAMERLIHDLRSRQMAVVFASSSNYWLIQAFGEALHADFVMGTRLEVRDGFLTDRMEVPLCLHLGKAWSVLAYLQAIGASRDHLTVYTDGVHLDLPLLLTPSDPRRAFAVKVRAKDRHLCQGYAVRFFNPEPPDDRWILHCEGASPGRVSKDPYWVSVLKEIVRSHPPQVKAAERVSAG